MEMRHFKIFVAYI